MHRKQHVKDDQHVTCLGSGSESHTPDNSSCRTPDNLHVSHNSINQSPEHEKNQNKTNSKKNIFKTQQQKLNIT